LHFNQFNAYNSSIIEKEKKMQERFIDNGDGTILDASTGLTWQKDTPDGYFSFEEAKKYAEAFDLSGKGWRIPTRMELLGIVDHEKTNPCISEVFGKTFLDWYWTSTLFSGRSSNAWSVDFSYGNSGNYDVTNDYRVRCVR
jgi:hypothetical protein